MPVDVLLSVQKYTALVLGDAWEVRLEQDRGSITKPGKPIALVVVTGPVSPAPRAGMHRQVELTWPLAIHCYPLRKDSQEDAELQVLDVTEQLLQGFATQGRGLGRPLRVPLFDYADVDVSVADSDVRGDRDFVRLANLDVSRLPDGQDPRLIRVILAFQTMWRRAGYIPSSPQELGGDGPELASVTAVGGDATHDVEELAEA